VYIIVVLVVYSDIVIFPQDVFIADRRKVIVFRFTGAGGLFIEVLALAMANMIKKVKR
jgi:hypothetical protein